MTERVHRLVMHAFRGIPGEMTVDFGKGQSVVVYGDNGTGKSTIADALEWYFLGEIDFLSHEGRQHAVRHVGSESDGVTSIEVLTSGTLGGKAVFPDERTPENSTPSDARPSSSAVARLQTSSTRRRPRSGRPSSTSSAWTRSRASRGPSKGAKRASQAGEALGGRGPDVSTGPGVWIRRSQSRDGARQPSADLRDAWCRSPGSLDQVADPSWLTGAVGASASGSGNSDRGALLAEIKSLNTPALDRSAVEAWNDLISSDRARRLPRASLVREAKRLVTPVNRQRTLPALRPDGGSQDTGAENRERPGLR